MKFFFLHIGKTGGSAVQHALRSLAREDIVLCGHDVSLNDVPRGAKAVASIRHPVDRFVSGFYSRLRQGLPRYNAP